MRKEGDLMVCTVKELAEFVAEGVNCKEPLKSRIRECDFAILDEDDTGPLEVIKTGAVGWYGVKVVPDLGFDSPSLILVTDYYGGECNEFCSIWPDSGGYLNPKDAIQDMILSSLENQEVADAATELFVEMKRYVKGTGLPD